MKKFKFFIDLEKEEKWLDEMAKQGWELYRKFFMYEFRKITPSDINIKIDYRCFKTKDDFLDYITLFSDSGWQHIAGTKTSGTQYFKRIDDNGDEDIFSDASSKAARYKRLSDMWASIATAYVPLFVVLYSTKSINVSALLNPKLLYLTPGLWEKTGIKFWRSFLFETPFVLMRSSSWLLFLGLIILYFIFAFKANAQYKRVNLEHEL